MKENNGNKVNKILSSKVGLFSLLIVGIFGGVGFFISLRTRYANAITQQNKGNSNKQFEETNAKEENIQSSSKILELSLLRRGLTFFALLLVFIGSIVSVFLLEETNNVVLAILILLMIFSFGGMPAVLMFDDGDFEGGFWDWLDGLIGILPNRNAVKEISENNV